MTENLQRFNESAIRIILKVSSLCGITAPILFTIMVIFESTLRPGYSQISNFISDLGVGRYAVLQDVNFWIFGVLVFIFALGFGRNFLRSMSITITLSVVAWMVFLAGVFPDAPAPYPADVHDAVSMIAFLSMVICEFFFWWRLRKIRTNNTRDPWNLYSYYSLGTGIVSIFLIFAGNPPGLAGLFQRFFVGVGWLWIEVMAIKLFLVSHQASPIEKRVSISK